MKIGEIAGRAGVPAKTIRFWEDQHLLPAPARTQAGYRDYDPPILERGESPPAQILILKRHHDELALRHDVPRALGRNQRLKHVQDLFLLMGLKRLQYVAEIRLENAARPAKLLAEQIE